MDIQPNENLIISLPEIEVREKEKVYVSNIGKQYICFQFEMNKDQYKSIYMEIKMDYSINASENDETIRLKRIKLTVLSNKEIKDLKKDKEKQNSLKFIKLLQKNAGIRFRYFIPVRFMVKIYNRAPEEDYYRKVFFREGLFKVQLISADAEDAQIWFYDLDAIEFEPIDEKINSKKIISINPISKNIKNLFDDFAKELGYWAILEKTLSAGIKLHSLFKKKGK